MVQIVSACVAGLFVFENGKVVEHILFPKDPAKIAEKLDKFEKGEELAELKNVKAEREVNYKPLIENFRDYAVKYKFVENQGELNKIIAAVSVERSKEKISKKERRDKLIVQSISAYGDMEKILNLMTERLREWFGLHYPELKISDHERFVKLVAEYGRREKFKEFERSMGIILGEDDVKIIKKYAKQVSEMSELKKDLSKYLEEIVPKEMPNTSKILGPILAARLLSYAGSLEKLAKMPSTTVQLLGAEKALFKYLRGKQQRSPPKHGIIFLAPEISSAPRELKGKVARLLAAKVTIAARTDFYTKEDISEGLLRDLKKKLSEINR